MFCTFIFAV